MRRSKRASEIHARQRVLWRSIERLLPDLHASLLRIDDEYEKQESDEEGPYSEEDALLDSDLAESNLKDADKGWCHYIQSERFGDYDDIEHPDSLPMDDDLNRQRLSKLIRNLSHHVSKKDAESILETWTEFSDLTLDLGIVLPPETLDGIQALIEDLDDATPSLFYVGRSKAVELIVPSLLTEASLAIARRISAEPRILLNMSPRSFEEFIAEIFASFGYRVELTAQTRDGGRDIVAIANYNNILTKVLVECKRYAPNRPVGISHVRELYAVKSIEHASKAVLATTSYFSHEARQFEAQYLYELELKDFNAVTAWAQQYSQALLNIRRR